MVLSADLIRVIGDGISAVSCFLLWIISFKTTLIFPFRRGFFCEDTSIRLPYKQSTVSDTTLIVCFLLVPMCILAIYESSIYYLDKQKMDWIMLFNVYDQVVVFMFGCSLSLILVQMVKFLIGRLRPHFIDACGPNVDCNEKMLYKYITNYTCTSMEESSFKDWHSRQSFPSAHATLSTQAMTYLCLYLQIKFRFKGIFLLRHTLQIALMSVAAWVCLSRIIDNESHLSDVVTGVLTGTTFAFLMAFFMIDCFKNETWTDTNVRWH